MPRIINAYEGNSAVGDSLAKLGEAIYGDQAKNEVFRQKAFGLKRNNDAAIPLADALARGDKNEAIRQSSLADRSAGDASGYSLLSRSNHATGLDDPALALAQIGAGGSAGNTFAGQGRSLANDRATNAATNAAGERNNVRTNAETRYGTDRRYDSDIATTGMNNASSERVGAGNNNTSITVGQGNNAATLESQRIQSERAAATQLAIDARTMTPVGDGNGGFTYAPKSEASGREAPMSTDQVKAGVISQALRKTAQAQQPQAFPEGGASPWNSTSPPQQSAAPAQQPQKDIFAHLSPQVRGLVGVNTEQPMIDPRTGATGVSRDSGTTLDNGQSAASYVPTDNAGRMAQERDNNVRTQAGTVLPPAPTVYPDSAKDAALTSGPKSAAQTVTNHTLGLIGVEPFPAVNRARETMTNQAQALRDLIASAPGRAAVMDKKWADEMIPQPGFMGVTGMNATEQQNRSVQLTDHLRQMYGIVQQDAVDPNTPPAERVKMAAYLRNLGNAIELREKVTPDAPPARPNGSRPNAPVPGGGALAASAAPAQAENIPTLTPEQAMQLAPGTPFKTIDGRVKYR